MDDFGNCLSRYRTWDGMGKGTGFFLRGNFNYTGMIWYRQPWIIADEMINVS